MAALVSDTAKTTPIGPALLIVDDNEMVLEALRRSLAASGCRIFTTTRPEEALGIVEREGVSILLSDMDMPRLNGLELVALVKRAHPEVVRILLTGRGSMEAALSAINEGEVFRFLTKPWEVPALRDVIADAVAKAGELRSDARRSVRPDRRGGLHSALESEHPGITSVELSNGVYCIDSAAVEATLAALPPSILTTVWEP